MSETETPPTSGLVAGKYQLVSLIGRGGMGSVWLAHHASLGTRVAVKFIEAEYASSQEARIRFDREARAAATIQSKHAIQIFDHGVTDDGKPFIVMELLDGEPLDKRIEQRQLSLQETAHILQQVCRGLSRAHERGVVHRDLKPENIFLVRSLDDDDEIAKVLDFGVAKIKSQDNELGPSTKTGAVLGTPFFMSPEQARGLRNVDHRTDLWSLGVIAYRCVTGALPFDGESVGDLLVKICTAPLPVPSQVVPNVVNGAFDAWFARALERDPERRFGSAQELSDALAHAAGIPVRSPTSRQSANVDRPTIDSQPEGAPLSPLHRTPSGAPLPTLPMAPAAGITEAPLSSSHPGVPRSNGRGAYVAVAAALGLTVALIGAVVMYKMQGPKTDVVASPTTNVPDHAPAKAPPAPSPTLAGGEPHEDPPAHVPTHAASASVATASLSAAASSKPASTPSKTKLPALPTTTTAPQAKPSTQPATKPATPTGPAPTKPAKAGDDPGF